MSYNLFRINLILINCLLTWCCNQGQYSDNGLCVDCSPNCLACTQANKCDTCKPGFYLLSDVHECDACQNGCQTCSLVQVQGYTPSVQKQCSICFPKYYLSGINCSPCPSQCATCMQNGLCNTCEIGNFLDQGACQPCDPSCKMCMSSTLCFSCQDGRYLSNNLCLPCQYPCLHCMNNSNNCLSCVDSDRKPNSSQQCVCKDEYYTDGSYQCQACTAPCSKCQLIATNCTDCIFPFILSRTQYQCECSPGYVQATPQSCLICIKPCKTCEQYQYHCLSCVDVNQVVNSLFECECKAGWIMDSDGITCIKCQLPCINCVDTKSKCVTCQDSSHQQPDTCQCGLGWGYDSNYFCILCQQPCQTCQISTSQCLTCVDVNQEVNSASQCVCKPGYLQSGLLCLKCQSPCSTCTDTISNCLTCEDPTQIIENQCSCKEGFVQRGDFCCDKYCIDCQGIGNCNSCMKGFYLSTINRCIECIINCGVCFNQVTCDICQDGYFVNQLTLCEACIPYCITCTNQFNCDVCLDGYFLLDQNCEPCNNNCLTCEGLPEKCLTCRLNQEINSNNQCVCKIGYYEQQNQCHRCEYPCKACLNQTICQECFPLSRLYLDLNSKCSCNPGYFWNQNSCSQCYQFCLTCIDNYFNCLSCDDELHRVLKNNKCQCAQNYFESEDALCISCLGELGKTQESCKYQDCKDQIWTYGEGCDDGNDVVRDGCSNCQIDHNYSCKNEILKTSICFQCSINCIECELNTLSQKTQCIRCEIGYFLDKNDCVKCSANCLECIDQAQNCVSCKILQQKNHKCQLCESGYYAEYINGTCLNKCGDYIKVNEEECDDGNNLKGDGCDDQCKLENNYIIVNGVIIVPDYPKPLLQSVGTSQVYSPNRLFKLSYSVPIFIRDGFQIKDYLTFNFSNDLGVQQMDQSFELTQDIAQINSLNQSLLNLMIKINYSRDSQDEILLIKFLNNSMIYSTQGYSQIETEVSCLIPKVIYIDDTTITRVQLATKSNSYILYFILAMCGGSIVFGGIEAFFNLLDTLQMLSYLKYINTQLPYNLQIYFALFEFAQFNFIQKIFDFSGIIELILKTQNFNKLPSKIASDYITSLFMINSATISAVWISLFSIYAIAKVVPKILSYIKLNVNPESQTQDKRILKLGVYLLTIKLVINRLCFVIVQEFFYSGILRAYMATAYEFAFCAVLQLYTLEFNSTNDFIRFNSFLACLASAAHIYSIYFVIKVAQMKKCSVNSKAIQIKYGSIFEGVKINQFSKYFNAILLIKKLIFILLLIFAYDFPAFQSISITILSISFCLFYIRFQPLQDKLEQFKQLFCEISVSCTLFNITILSCDFELVWFTYEIRQYLGWGCIFCMTSILSVQLAIDGFQQWKFLFQKYKTIRKIAQFILQVLKKKGQVRTSSTIFQ
ncbi:unnamed protein product (macronuclear) [Paramecium tetraurelia]|uniref:EGF-like domain-containing protein n=1 Tax=Paramecium tetraurelia TaxID=5888 RepID=A0BJL2_PARTE|nr:uncharacterized protein GSPATT00029357001 [Paramecium tetraurelia]CAK58729.1 unnamed protein product [Paramecium tetraurelia]|eukprot:XP_001426127.1 hypothetical protein (macronuclear) [Paramecium tetraurelia strain d4-2]